MGNAISPKENRCFFSNMYSFNSVLSNVNVIKSPNSASVLGNFEDAAEVDTISLTKLYV